MLTPGSCADVELICPLKKRFKHLHPEPCSLPHPAPLEGRAHFLEGSISPGSHTSSSGLEIKVIHFASVVKGTSTPSY